VFVLNFLNFKGFIGAIGDDLPSLIPVMVALLLFFSIFSFTLSAYNSRSMDLQKKIEMVSIARVLKGNSLILSLEQFRASCDSILSKKKAFSFAAGIYPVDSFLSFSESSSSASSSSSSSGSSTTAPTEKLDVIADMKSIISGIHVGPTAGIPYNGILTDTEYSMRVGKADDGMFFCSFKELGVTKISDKSYSTKFYPVAVQIKNESTGQFLTRPAIMVVVIWN
jgi:hypothetical protein